MRMPGKLAVVRVGPKLENGLFTSRLSSCCTHGDFEGSLTRCSGLSSRKEISEGDLLKLVRWSYCLRIRRSWRGTWIPKSYFLD